MARRRRRKGRSRKRKLKLRGPQKIVLVLVVLAAVFFLVPRLMPPQKHKPAPSKPAPKKIVQPVKRVSKPPAPKPPVPKPLPQRSVPPPAFRELIPGAPKIVIVIDDIGHTIENLQEFRGLGNRVTYAILPFLKYSAYFDRLSAETGAEVILHMPLESVKETIPGPGLIRTNMSRDYVLDILERELNQLPHSVGANNHMGSKGSADAPLMEILLGRLKQRKMLFLDSMTTAQSVGVEVGRRLRLPVLKRDVFLDNDDDPAAIRGQLQLLADIARKRGHAVGIGHYHTNTIYVLREEIPRLEREGFQFVSLRDLLRLRKS